MIDTVYLCTDTPEFANDLADEIRLYLPDAHIVCEEGATCALRIDVSASTDGGKMTAKATACGAYEGSYIHTADFVQGDELVTKRHMKRCVKVTVFRLLRDIFPDTYLPWGSLTGIRPTRLMRDLADEMGEGAAHRAMAELFDVDDRKIALVREILACQEPYIRSVKPSDVDIYIGIPYCKTRCLYCSFPSDVRTQKTDMRPYIDALKDDIRRGSELLRRNGYHVRASYMGGGTPTVLTEDELREVIEYALDCYGSMGCEFTVEAGRPDTITRRKLEILKEYGVNRISVNPQTMNDKTLALIGRSHTADELMRCYYEARNMGFCINTDIITCLPGEGEAELEYTLRRIREMNPDNLTVHTLALKNSSKLKQVIGEEEIRSIMPDASLADKMVEMGLDTAHDMGMTAYYMYRQKYMRGNLENVGYALTGTVCVYNIDMMEETVSIMAHGAGSMSKRIYQGRSLRVERIPNPKDIATYISKLDTVYADKERLFSPIDE